MRKNMKVNIFDGGTDVKKKKNPYQTPALHIFRELEPLQTATVPDKTRCISLILYTRPL